MIKLFSGSVGRGLSRSEVFYLPLYLNKNMYDFKISKTYQSYC